RAFIGPELSAYDPGEIEVVYSRATRDLFMTVQEVPVPNSGGNKRRLTIGVAYHKERIWHSPICGANGTTGNAVGQSERFWSFLSVSLLERVLLPIAVNLHLEMPVILSVLQLMAWTIRGKGQ